MERPDVLVLDEPTATLGARTRRTYSTSSARSSARAPRSSSSATGSTRSWSSPTRSRCSGTAASSESEPRRALTRPALVELLGGAPKEAEELESGAQPAPVSTSGPTAAPPRAACAVESPDLDNPVDLTIDAGEVVGLAGLVGAGRSTLATILAGGGTVSGGTISIDGTEVSLRNRRVAIDHGIVLVPPDRGEGIVPEL